MSEMKFRIGDPVRIINPNSSLYSQVGLVIGFEGKDLAEPYSVKTLTGFQHGWFWESHLELAEPALASNESKAPQPKFKVGDRVRVIAVESAMYRMVGCVKRYDKDLSLPYHVESECMNWDNRFRADELEPAPVVKESSITDNVNHPPHYNQGGIECIEAIKAATGSGFVKYCTGNVIKYLWRYDNKGGLEDLKKAAWYLDRAIKEMEVSGE